MTETPRRKTAWFSQLLRGGLGLSFPWLLTAIPADRRFTGPAMTAGVLLFVVARVASLFEPETLRRTIAPPLVALEGLFVTLALILALVLMNEADYVDIGIGTGVFVVLGYFVLHVIAMPFILGMRSDKLAEAKSRPALRGIIYTGAFVAEEAAALTCISLAVQMHVEARQGPWGLWDLVPIFPVILLVVFYVPMALFEASGHPRLSTEDSYRAAFEGALLQIGAVLVAALTGVVPWV